MQKLMQSKLFRLLSEASIKEVSTSLLEESYDEFALKILTRFQCDTNHEELYFNLGFIHTKLAGICERLTGEQEKKCLKIRIESYVFDRNGYAGYGVANNSSLSCQEV